MPARSPTDEFGALTQILLAGKKSSQNILSLRSTIISCGFTQKLSREAALKIRSLRGDKKKLFPESLMSKN
jgi:hypothetical protein